MAGPEVLYEPLDAAAEQLDMVARDRRVGQHHVAIIFTTEDDVPFGAQVHAAFLVEDLEASAHGTANRKVRTASRQ